METVNIDFIVPKGWQDLDDAQLRFVYRLLAESYSSEAVKTLCLLRWSGCRVISKFDNTDKQNNPNDTNNLGNTANKWLLKLNKTEFVADALQIAEILPALDWIDSIPTYPVRPTHIGHYAAVAADFEDVPFETYIICENLYQGFLSTKRDDLLDEIAVLLYHKEKKKKGSLSHGSHTTARTTSIKVPLTPEYRIAIFYWLAALKTYFAKRFPDFFQPVADDNLLGGTPNIGERLQESVNAQIRALTKGDITKEKQILSLDTWRALTELNAQAKEYKEINAKLKHTS